MSLNNGYAIGQGSNEVMHVLHPRLKYPNLWRGCVGAWAPCLGPGGLRLQDNSGYGNHGTLTNMDPATDWVVKDGFWGVDISTDNGAGTSDYFALSSTIKIEAGYTLTTAFWANISSWVGSNPGGWRSASNFLGLEFCIFQASTGRPLIRRNNTNVLNPASGGAVALNVLSHVVFVSSPTRAELWLNGDLLHGADHAITGTASEIFVFPGQATNVSQKAVGVYYDWRFYNRVVTPVEIKQLYNVGPAGPYETTTRRSAYNSPAPPPAGNRRRRLLCRSG